MTAPAAGWLVQQLHRTTTAGTTTAGTTGTTTATAAGTTTAGTWPDAA